MEAPIPLHFYNHPDKSSLYTRYWTSFLRCNAQNLILNPDLLLIAKYSTDMSLGNTAIGFWALSQTHSPLPPVNAHNLPQISKVSRSLTESHSMQSLSSCCHWTARLLNCCYIINSIARTALIDTSGIPSVMSVKVRGGEGERRTSIVRLVLMRATRSRPKHHLFIFFRDAAWLAELLHYFMSLFGKRIVVISVELE